MIRYIFLLAMFSVMTGCVTYQIIPESQMTPEQVEKRNMDEYRQQVEFCKTHHCSYNGESEMWKDAQPH